MGARTGRRSRGRKWLGARIVLHTKLKASLNTQETIKCQLLRFSHNSNIDDFVQMNALCRVSKMVDGFPSRYNCQYKNCFFEIIQKFLWIFFFFLFALPKTKIRAHNIIFKKNFVVNFSPFSPVLFQSFTSFCRFFHNYLPFFNFMSHFL